MILSSISLKNVRSHTKTEVNFANNLNYIVGENGIGKTTILEAIYYLCTTKSCVTASDAEVVKFGHDGFEIFGKISGLTNDDIQIKYSVSENKKTILLGNKQVNRFSDIIGKFPIVMLSPADHTLTQGHSADRRKFVDSVISQASRTYLNLIIEYNRIIKQRTSLLIRLKESPNNKDELRAWNEKLLQTGIEIIKHRKTFVEEFVVYMKNSYDRILKDKENPGISYYFLDGYYGEMFENYFANLLEERQEEEIARSRNLVGPHKDDFIFEINNIKLKNFGSQGQHKTFQTILKFAEYFYLKDKAGNKPLFLLDDVFGELDAIRAASISNYLGLVGQAFITLTDFGNLSFLKSDASDKLIRLTINGEVLYE